MIKNKGVYTIMVLALVGQSLAQLGKGSCKNCVDCKFNGSYESCQECYLSKHVITNGADGRCEGTDNGIQNCLATKQSQLGQRCTLCAEGYGLYSKTSSVGASATTEHQPDFKCYPVTIENALNVLYYYDSGTNAKKEKVVSCKPGYELSNDECSLISDGTKQRTVANCKAYSDSGNYPCIFCVNNLIPLSNNDFTGIYNSDLVTCVQSPLNSIAIDTARYGSIRNGRWVYGGKCNAGGGFTVSDINVYGWSENGSNTFSCTSELGGDLGEKL